MALGGSAFGSAPLGGIVGSDSHPPRENRMRAQKFFGDFLVNGRRLLTYKSPLHAELLWVDEHRDLIGPKHPDTIFNSFRRIPESNAHVYDEPGAHVTEIPVRLGTEPVALVRVRSESREDRQTTTVYVLARLIEFLIAGFNMPETAYALLADLKQIREELGLSTAQLAERLLIARETIERWESGLPPDFDLFYRWLKALQIVCPADSALVEVVDVTDRLILELKHNPHALSGLTPETFEQFVAERLDKMGFSVQRTGSINRKDGGIDIVAVSKTAGNFLLAAQIKHHEAGHKSGRSDVDRLLAWQGKPFAVGMLVTNTTFTADARWVAEQIVNKAFLRLRDVEDVRKWLENNFTEESRELPNEILLAPGVSVKVPKPDLRTLLPPGRKGID